jgi:hypothetical protein
LETRSRPRKAVSFSHSNSNLPRTQMKVCFAPFSLPQAEIRIRHLVDKALVGQMPRADDAG